MTTDPRDPGWGTPRRVIRRVVLPWPLLFWSARNIKAQDLSRLRGVYLDAINLGVVGTVLGVVLALTQDGDPSLTVAVVFLLVAAGASIAGVMFYTSRFQVSAPFYSAALYRVGLPARIAFALSPILIGLTLVANSPSMATPMIAAIASIPAMWLAAPTATSIQRLQQRLTGFGNEIDLLGDLLRTHS